MKTVTKTIAYKIQSFFSEPITKYIIIITSIISILVIFEAVYDGLIPPNSGRIRFLSAADKQLAMNFIEWFGVLYGFLLPMILIRVWEQFDEIDNVLDREADAIKILIGDLSLLPSQFEGFKINVLRSLHIYTLNVVRLIDGEIVPEHETGTGNEMLTNIRRYYIEVFHHTFRGKLEIDTIKDELLAQLNDIIEYRGDRISLSTQRLFESLNFVAIITSILWLVPFYFLHFQNPQTGGELQLGIFGWLLVIAVTFLVIIILTIIDDLDSPFDGYWRVNISSWVNLVSEIKNELDILSNTDNVAQEIKKTKRAKIKPKQ